MIVAFNRYFLSFAYLFLRKMGTHKHLLNGWILSILCISSRDFVFLVHLKGALYIVVLLLFHVSFPSLVNV